MKMGLNAKLEKIRGVVALLLLALLPFHALVATALGKFLGDFEVLGKLLAWKELLAIAVIGLCAIEVCIKIGPHPTIQKIKKALNIDFLDIILALYIGVGLAFVFTQQTPLSQWAHGVRISILPFALLLVGRKVSWPNAQKLLKTVLIVGLITSIFGISQALILPESWLGWLGYAQNIITDVPGAGPIVTGVTSDALQACPPLEHTSEFCRAISTFGGPTRFGVYLLGIIGLALVIPMRRSFRVTLLTFAAFAALLTYSRSVWLGLIALVCVFAWLKLGKKALIMGAASLVLVGVVGVFAWNIRSGSQHENPIKSLLTRVNSTQLHVQYLKNGVQAVEKNPLGYGLGTAGPASVRYTPFLTENWFLQIFVEMGVLGGGLFLIFIGALVRALYKAKTPLSQGLLLGLIGMCVAGLVTHSFEELAASYMVGIVGGVAIRKG